MNTHGVFKSEELYISKKYKLVLSVQLCMKDLQALYKEKGALLCHVSLWKQMNTQKLWPSYSCLPVNPCVAVLSGDIVL